ncbi:MAG: type II toxin-antitoxin system VapC family toxin [Candidatus Kapabacteria bacterium]|jgi:predicted nucleic acid-binding protein|nr:type II toxin-antitoxin system VapC family toxin [Candidatus Kapabacteria bacterium]
MTTFFDTNTVLKIYHIESGTDDITDFLLRHRGRLTIVISELTRVEVRSALMRRVRMKEMSSATAEKLYALFGRHAASMAIQPLTTQICTEAIRLLEQYSAVAALKTLYSLQIASALEAHRTIPLDYVLSSDETFLSVMKNYLPALNPISDVLP